MNFFFQISSLRLAFAPLLMFRAYGDIDWTVHPLPREQDKPPTILRDVAYGNGLFIAVGEEGEIFRASNPHEWKLLRKGELRFRAAAFGEGQFVVSALDTTTMSGAIVTSPDGELWTRYDLDEQKWLGSIVYGNGIFVAAGYDLIARSEDGLEWSIDTQFVRHPPIFLNALDFAAGSFLACERQPFREGYRPSIAFLRSGDGRTWQRSDAVYDYGVVGFAYGRGKFFAAGLGSDCDCPGPNLISSDGLNWSPLPPASFSAIPRAVAFGNGVFAMPTSKWDGGELLTSQDLSQWHTFKLEQSTGIDRIVFAQNRFVGVGAGIIVVSEEISFQPLISNLRVQLGSVHFDVDAPEGTVWEVQTSSDLRDWRRVGSFEGTASESQQLSYSLGEIAGFLQLKKVE